MHIELSHDEAEALRDLLRQRIVDLDKEINRTDSLAFKHRLQQLDRRIERALGEKCQRCWRVLPEVGVTDGHAELCRRCADAVAHLAPAGIA